MRKSFTSILSSTRLLTLDTLHDNYHYKYLYYSVAGIIVYLIVGILYYHIHVNFNTLDAIYFAITTMLTIGYLLELIITPSAHQYRYGDFTPDTPNQRLFTCFYILFGLAGLSAIIASAGDLLLKRHDDTVHDRVRIAAERMNSFQRGESYLPPDLDGVVREEKRDASDNIGDERSPSIEERVRNGIQRITKHLSAFTAYKPTAGSSNAKALDVMRRMNIEMFDEEMHEIRRKAARDFFIVFATILIGCLCMLGDWTFMESLYWSIVTITTVGYGDVTPDTHGGKAFTIVYCLVGCTFLAKGLNDLIRYPLIKRSKFNELRIMMQFGDELSEETLVNILRNDFFDNIPRLRGDKMKVTKCEFVLMLLNMMGKIHAKDILIVAKIFDTLDDADAGALSFSTINVLIEKAKRREAETARLEAEARENEQNSSLLHQAVASHKIISSQGSSTLSRRADGVSNPVWHSSGLNDSLLDNRVGDASISDAAALSDVYRTSSPHDV